MFYIYNTITKEYIGEGKDTYYTLDGKLVSGYTKVKPPIFTSDEVCKFIDGKWQVSLKPKDYRGNWVDINGDTQNITELDILPPGGYAKEDNSKWYFADGTLATDITNAQLDKRKWQTVRNKRDELLRKSDVYMLVDNYNNLPLKEQADWIDYRQNLRDIPQTYAKVSDVVYPKKPIDLKETDLTKEA